MKKDYMTSNAKYLEIIFPWDEELCDLEDNLNVTRLQKLDSAAADRINRYPKALRFLNGEI